MKQLFFCSLLLCAVCLPAIAQNVPIAQPLTPLERILNPDGTVKLHGQFHGALDVKGWQMRTDAKGKPRFVQHVESSAVVPADSLWDDRFGDPGMNTSGVVYAGVRALAVIGTDLY